MSRGTGTEVTSEMVDDADAEELVDTDFSGVEIAGAEPESSRDIKLPPGLDGGNTDTRPGMIAEDDIFDAPGDDIDPEDVPTPDPIVRTMGVSELSKKHRWGTWHLPGRAVDCDCDAEAAEECDCDKAADGQPFRSDVPPVESLIDAIEMTADDELPGDKKGPRCTLYGRVIDRQSVNPGSVTDLRERLTLADPSGVAVVQVTSETPGEPGDEIVMTHVMRHGDPDSVAELEITTSTHVEQTGPSLPVHCCLEERSELHRADEVFYDDNTSVTAARNWMADVIIREHHIETPLGSEDIWMYVDDEDSDDYGIFVDNGEDRLKELIDEYLPVDYCNSQNKGQIVSLIRDRTRVPEDAHEQGAEDHPARRWSIAVQNGVIDLRTGELHEHAPEWRCHHKLPVEYHLDEYSGLGPAWDRFLSNITKTPEDKRVLLYAIAHALPRCYPVEALFALIGPGSNGKTTWSKAVKALLGDDVVGAWKLSTLCGQDSQFGTGPLVGNHMSIDDDATSVKVSDITPLKTHTGGDAGQVNIKNEKIAGYDNYATLVMLSNDPPVIGDKSEGAKRRVYPVILPYEFVENPDPDVEQEKPSRSEEELLAELTADEELEALLVEAVRLCQEMYEIGEIKDGRTRDERWELYQQYSDSILRFWRECMTQSRGTRVPRSVVYEVYVRWCDANGIEPVSNKGTNSFWSLSDQCPIISYNRDGVWADGERAVEHVNLTADALEYAPGWITDQWGDDVEDAGDDGVLANRLDRVTPIADLSMPGAVTTEGTVKRREDFETSRGPAVKLWIEDDTRAIKVIEYVGENGDATLDGVKTGDRVRLYRAILCRDNRSVPQLQIEPYYTEVEVVEAGPLNDVDDRHVEANEDDAAEPLNDDGESPAADPAEGPDAQTARNTVQTGVQTDGSGASGDAADDENARAAPLHKETVGVVISELEGDAGAPIEDVIAETEDRTGDDPRKVRRIIRKMKTRGDVYEPAAGMLRYIGPHVVGDA